MPAILMLTLQRFRGGKKNEDVVKFPLKGLSLEEYCAKTPGTSASTEEHSVYDLFGVINQVGSLLSGHYTAKCFNEEANCWYNFDDSRVNKIETTVKQDENEEEFWKEIEENIVTEKAYVLFYRKRGLQEAIEKREGYE